MIARAAIRRLRFRPLLVIARIRRRVFIGIALPGRMRGIPRGELPRREIRIRRSDPLLEPLDLETRGLLVLHNQSPSSVEIAAQPAASISHQKIITARGIG